MKRLVFLMSVGMALWIGTVPARAGGWHGGGCWGGHGWCGGGWWPSFSFGIGFGASYPVYGYGYSYPVYSYAYAPVVYSQPAYVYRTVQPAPTYAYTQPAPPAAVQQRYSPPSGGAVATTAALSPAPAATTPARGTWVLDAHPYIYTPAPAPSHVNYQPETQTVVVLTSTGMTPVYVVSR